MHETSDPEAFGGVRVRRGPAVRRNTSAAWTGFIYYPAIVGIVDFAREGRFAAGFDVETIKTVALDREYAIAWLTSVAVVAVGFVGAIPVVAANLRAGGFAAAMDSTPRPSRPGEGSGEDTVVWPT